MEKIERLNILKKTYQWLFILGIFFIPFNSKVPKLFKVLGELGSDSSPVFFLGSFLFLVIYQFGKGKIYFPFSSKIYQSFLFFLLILLTITAINLPQIVDYYFKFTRGPERFIRQFLSIVISGILFFYVFVNIVKDYGAVQFFKTTRKVFLFSFIIVFLSGILEYAVASLGLGFLYPAYDIFNYLPFVEGRPDTRLFRISATTYEPPALGTYLITISGFMFSYILTSKKSIRFIPFLCLALLAILSKSRTALVVVIFQSIVGVGLSYYMYYSFRKYFNVLALIGVVFISIIVFVKRDIILETAREKIASLDFTKTNNKTDDHSISNKTRMGTQIAMWEVFKENPVFGVGWGMQAFEAKKKYPFWAKNENYEFPVIYLNKNNPSFPPSFNLFLRVLSETGIVGFLTFLFFIFMIFYRLFTLYLKNDTIRPYTIALIICFAGNVLNWFQLDTLRVYGFWICLAILVMLEKMYRVEKATALESQIK